ncbi:hypothetical protein QDG88_14375 [Pseudoalteromonas piscicida]|nr:hypothetical protein [Pseudoalteromonas piscicida]MDP4489106.1 hypothetical protein [Pseudoalteromonas piscicida]
MPRIVGRDLSRRTNWFYLDELALSLWIGLSLQASCGIGLGRHAGGTNTG